mmetsp:Transcript_1070/g.1962  ORF Transcript_1070/g.1962 Transcript_1070/m.1962 type:complete len:295 (-) Transcript_1070:449-1333(-)
MGNRPSKDSKRLMSEAINAYNKALYKQAILYAEEALKLRELDQPDSLDMAETLNYLGKIHWRKGDLDTSLKYFKEALDIRQRHAPYSDNLAETLQNIGCIFCARGEYEQSMYLLESALAIREKTVPGSLSVAYVCNNLGIVLHRLGRTKEAGTRYEQSLKIKEKLAPRSASIVKSYISLSTMCKSERRLKLLEKARSIAVLQKPPRPETMVELLTALGAAYRQTGELDKALEHLQKALGIEQSIAPDSLKTAEIYFNLARALEDGGQSEAARAARCHNIRIRQLKAPTRLQVKK